MRMIEVEGIDRDGESRSVSFVVSGPTWMLAADLLDDGWRYARLSRDGATVGEVYFDQARLCRTWRMSGA